MKTFSVLAVFGMTVTPSAKFSATVVVLLAAAGLLQGQTAASEIVRPPPRQPGFKNLWNITLRNPTLDTWTVYFHAQAFDVKVGPVFAANSQEISLASSERSKKW